MFSLQSRLGYQWKETLSTGGTLLDCKIGIAGGTFSQFSEATQNRKIIEIMEDTGEDRRLSCFRPYHKMRTWDVLGVAASLGTLQSLLRGIGRAMIRSYGCSRTLTITANRLGLPSTADVATLMNFKDQSRVVEKTTNYSGFGPTPEMEVGFPNRDIADITPHLTNFITASGSLHLVKPLSNRVSISYPSLLFIAAYALGMLVRYHPTYWVSILSHHKGDGALPIIREASGCINAFSFEVTEYLQ